MEIVATICSRKKREDAGLLPAKERYTGEHIAAVDRIAQDAGKPLYILSGLLGLLRGDEGVELYDYLLTVEMVQPLSVRIATRLRSEGITGIDFYTQSGEKWRPYESAMRLGAEASGVPLRVHSL